METLEKRNWDKDDNSLLAMANLELQSKESASYFRCSAHSPTERSQRVDNNRDACILPLLILLSQQAQWKSHTSRAETNCNGLRAAFKSAVPVSNSYKAVAMDFSNSDGLDLEGLFGAILLTAAMIATGGSRRVLTQSLC